MLDFIDLNAVVAAFGAGLPEMASAAVVAVPLGLLAAAELFRAR